MYQIILAVVCFLMTVTVHGNDGSGIATITEPAHHDDVKAQTLHRFGFKEFTIPTKRGDINYYVHQSKVADPDKVVIYLQGTTPIPDPFFEAEKVNDVYQYYQYFSSDYAFLGDEYIYVVIGLPGVPAVKNQGILDIQKYNSLNSLDYRVFAADAVINHIASKLTKPEKIIVYGHSEGAFVAPKLATINDQITHLGVWGGSALPDFFDFVLFERKANLKGEQSNTKTQQNINALIEQFKAISQDPTNTVPSQKNEYSEYTNKRWWSYAEPTINHLIKLEIPIHVQVATEDESAPIESNYLIPLEFARLGKNNLSFNVCIDCDHGFRNVKTDKENWSEIFQSFISWTEEN